MDDGVAEVTAEVDVPVVALAADAELAEALEAAAALAEAPVPLGTIWRC